VQEKIKPMKIKHFLLTISFSLTLLTTVKAQELSRVEKFQRMENLLGSESYFGQHYTGFVLFDLDSSLMVFEKNSHLNFIPASTTKLFTFYASLVTLKDSTRTFKYLPMGNEVYIWGAGDPSWKYPKLPQPSIEKILRNFDQINFSISNWKDSSFGYGWQWDDYNFSYSAERSAFPIYGNLVTFQNRNKIPVSVPLIMGKNLIQSKKNLKGIERDFHSNSFYYNPSAYTDSQNTLPFITSPELFAQLAQGIIDKPVKVVDRNLPENHLLFKGGSLIPLWKEMLQESDNFIAEQLLMMVSDHLFHEMEVKRAIDYIKKYHLSDLPDAPQWVDGSGLSRHNLATPRSMITLMQKILNEMNREQLMQILAQGGVNGTLKNNYKSLYPYVFAKTGTVSNNHSLVGLIKTKQQKVYAFAFMNNNYLGKASDVRREMEKVLLFVRDHY
jgi:serine-type D-Ala-D-Ala carboxypeptidase/endopeptidase (penicillin-binding protein 4)